MIRPAVPAALLAAALLFLAPARGRAAADTVEELNVHNTELHVVLEALREQTGHTFIEDVPVQGKVTLHISRPTPLPEVLDQLLRGLNLAWRLEKGVYHISPRRPVKGVPLGRGLVTKTYTLNFAPAEEGAEGVRALLSEYGKVTADRWLNTITVTDVAEVHDSVEVKLDSLDKEGRRPAQVNIKAKILQIESSETADSAAAVLWSRYTAFLGVGSKFHPEFDPPDNWANYFSFHVGHWGIDDLVARYRSRIITSRLNVLAEPDLTVPHDKQAEIFVGEKLGQNWSGNFKWADVGIKLVVKPKVKAGGLIELEVEPTITERIGVQAFNGIDFLRNQRIKTKVEVMSGKTLRIGGLTFHERNEDILKIPVLGDLPLFGTFFRQRTVSTSKDEVVILVSPRLQEGIPPRCTSTAGISALRASLIVGTTDVMLDWSEDVPYDNVGVIRYHVYRDLRPITSTRDLIPLSRDVRGEVTSWTDATPKRRGVAYFYAVTAVDGADNEQAVSNSPSVAVPRR